MISIENVSKSFREKNVLQQISLDIPDNSITTFVGPNGVGKTTLLNILCGFLYPDSGKVLCENPCFRQDLFIVLSGSQQLYAKNTVKENIYFLSVLRGLSSAEIESNLEQYIKYFPIYNSIHSKLFEELSTGQKQLMTLLAALVLNAKYLLLDEPTEGLDLKHKLQLIEVLKIIKEFKTIIVTSHDADFITALSDKSFFFKDGKIIDISGRIKIDEFMRKYEKYYL